MQLRRASDADDAGATFGTVAIVAQVIDKQLYLQQRRTAG
jgi:hypothetical protein